MIVELRQYLLKPGRREELIDLFHREFVESQEELGMRVLGTFRDLDRPDMFVWLRGFSSMEARREGLTAFYSGPVWKKHGPAANATMLDSDDVLLLRTPSLPPLTEPLSATVFYGSRPFPPVAPIDGALATLETEYSPNDYPALPIRSEHAVVVLADPSVTVPPVPGTVKTEVLRLTPGLAGEPLTPDPAEGPR